MQVTHSVKLSSDEELNILELAVALNDANTSAAYSIEERPLVQEAASAKFKAALATLASTAFTFGHNIGVSSANVKDTSMYKE
jgi:hypothetical protein